MELEKTYQELMKQIDSSRILRNEEMKKHTSFKIGGKADLFIKIKTIAELEKVLHIAKKYNIPYLVIGNGSNLLIKDKGIRGIVIAIQLEECSIQQQGEKIEIKVQAGVKLATLAQMCLKKEITGLEFASRDSGNYRRSCAHECRSTWL